MSAMLSKTVKTIAPAPISNAELKLKQAALEALSRARMRIIEGNYGIAEAQLKTVLDCLELATEQKILRTKNTV